MKIALLCVLPALLIGGCASVDPTLITERIDERTGVTLTQLDQPISLVADKARLFGKDPFAFAAPYEVNRMGERRTLLWIAVPVEAGGNVALQLLVDGSAIAVANDPFVRTEGAVLRPPYTPPAPWAREFVVPLDRPLLDALGNAGRFTLAVRYTTGEIESYSTEQDPRAVLASFRERISW